MSTAAAPVSYGVARGGLWRAIGTGLTAMSAASGAAWLAWHAGLASGPMIAAALAAGVLAGGSLGCRLWPACGIATRIDWTGQVWRWDGAELSSNPILMIDAGRWMLLRRADDPGLTNQWMPVAAADDPAVWHRLRQALLATPTRQALPVSEAGATSS